MENLKVYLKSREFIVCSLLMLILMMIGIFDYFSYASGGRVSLFPEWVNRFSFWRHTMYYGTGSILMFLSPFIINILALTHFYNKIKGSYLKDVLLRQSYKKVITKNIVFAYIKSYLPFLIMSVLIFFLGSILYTSTLSNTEWSDSYTLFRYVGDFSPYVYIFLCHIALLLYDIMIVNIGLILLRKTRKLTVTLLLSFVVINALNFLIGNMDKFIEMCIGKNFLTEHLSVFNIYEGYMVQSSVMNAIINMGILAFITGLLVWKLYKNKESLVRDFE